MLFELKSFESKAYKAKIENLESNQVEMGRIEDDPTWLLLPRPDPVSMNNILWIAIMAIPSLLLAGFRRDNMARRGHV